MGSKNDLSATPERVVEPTPPPTMRHRQPDTPDAAASDDISSQLKKAMSHHQSGNFGEAATLYWAILEKEPDHVDALHLGGLIAHEIGDSLAAIQMISRAMSISISASWKKRAKVSSRQSRSSRILHNFTITSAIVYCGCSSRRKQSSLTGKRLHWRPISIPLPVAWGRRCWHNKNSAPPNRGFARHCNPISRMKKRATALSA